VQLADRGCVTEYERNQTFLEIIIIGWILSILVETLQRFKRRQVLATGMYGKGASLLSVLGIWDILDVLAVFFTLSARCCVQLTVTTAPLLPPHPGIRHSASAAHSA